MKHINTYNTIREAVKAIRETSKGLAAIYDCPLIASDCKTDCEVILKDIRDLKAQGLAKYCTEKNPFKFYMAVREHGQEGGTNKEYVKERCNHLGQPVFMMVLIYVDGKPVTVKYGTPEVWKK